VIQNLAAGICAVLTIATCAACGDATGTRPDSLVWRFAQSPAVGPVSGLSGTSSSDVWAAARNGLLHFNGATWSTVSTGYAQAPTHVWARTQSDVWVVGTDGIDPHGVGFPTILHYNGTAWSIASSPTRAVLNGIWSSSASDVWAVSDSGEIAHYDGTSWSSDSSQTKGLLMTVWGTSGSDVWAGATLALLHYDGSHWSMVSSPLSVWGIWATASSDVWVVGFPELLLHYDGSTWLWVARRLTSGLRAGTGSITARGEAGQLQTYICFTPIPSSASTHATVRHPRRPSVDRPPLWIG
jgi:hypothetical protein